MNIADDFPVLARQVGGNPVSYLDSAATSLTPVPVIDAVCRYYTQHSANIHRGLHMLSEEASDEYENARARLAGFLRAEISEIVFVRNTTEGLNVVAAGWPLPAGAAVLVAPDAHHSALLPWRGRARIEYLPVRADGSVDDDGYHAQLDRTCPALVVLTACSNLHGRYLDIPALAAAAHRVGALVVVDAAQYAPHRSIDVSAFGADFVAFSGHKMLGPTGIGVLWGRADLLDRLVPLMTGGGTVDWVDLDSARPRQVPHRLEAGTPAIASVYGLAAAVDYLERVGMPAVRDHDAALAAAMYAAASRRPWMRVVGGGDPAGRGAILSFYPGGAPGAAAELARLLSDSRGVMCRSGYLCAQPGVSRHAEGPVLRLSAYLYNTVGEIEAAFAAIDELSRFISPVAARQ